MLRRRIRLRGIQNAIVVAEFSSRHPAPPAAARGQHFGLVATPLSRPLVTREISTTIRWASGSLRRREKSWERCVVSVCTKCKNRVSKRS